MRERERQTDRDGEREFERQIETEIEREIESERERVKERERERESERERTRPSCTATLLSKIQYMKKSYAVIVLSNICYVMISYPLALSNKSVVACETKL